MRSSSSWQLGCSTFTGGGTPPTQRSSESRTHCSHLSHSMWKYSTSILGHLALLPRLESKPCTMVGVQNVPNLPTGVPITQLFGFLAGAMIWQCKLPTPPLIIDLISRDCTSHNGPMTGFLWGSDWRRMENSTWARPKARGRRLEKSNALRELPLERWSRRLGIGSGLSSNRSKLSARLTHFSSSFQSRNRLEITLSYCAGRAWSTERRSMPPSKPYSRPRTDCSRPISYTSGNETRNWLPIRFLRRC